ncbi:hypothetical protein M9Y10_013686 [Tritrichomonas musculus]|uniref:Tubby C-terminal domain-containing protein n=1 Tax=Tritrichomonas musculus TaxID=1915356 RepID=A0ABR2KYJ9_9EUKA
MRRKPGEKLFTIEFSSSYEDEEDELPSQEKIPQPSQKKTFIPTKTTTIKISKTTPKNIGGLVELSNSYSDSYSYSSNATPKLSVKRITETPKKQDSDQFEKEKDIFTIGENEQSDQLDLDDTRSKVKKTQINNNNDTQNNNTNQNNFQKQESDGDTPINVKPPPRQSLPVQIEPQNSTELQEHQQIKPENPIYLIKRETKAHLNGRRIFFNFYIGDQQVYTAKCKTKNSDHVYIMKGNDAHLSSTADAIMLIGNDGSDFSLRKKEDLGEEILTIRILPPKTTADTSRKMTISFFSPLEGTPKKIFAKSPGLNPDGKIEHDFEGRFAVESIKNAVLVSKLEGPSLMFIRKTGKDAIEIEAKFKHEDLWIFSIGIASFMSKVKGIK